MAKKIEVKTPTKVKEDKKDKLVKLLQLRTPKLFDREPSGYSLERIRNLADEILGL
jgi:hypothetical protein